VPEDEEFGLEIIQFYLGNDIKGVISPATFGEPCAIMETFEKLNAGDEDDKELAATFKPKSKYVIPVVKYKDIKGKEVDHQIGERLAMLTSGQYQDLVDYFLDEEKGDFTNPKTGYDIKFSRTGSGQFDTEYSTMDCKPTKLDKKYIKKIYDPEEMLRKEMPSYEDTEELINKFLGLDDEDESLKKKKKKKSSKKTSTKKKSSKKKKKSDL
jgi:hypothetical protein